MSYDSAGIYEHALVAVLYAAQKDGANLEALLAHVKNDTPGNNSIRPLPQHQEEMYRVIEHAINDVKHTSK